MPSKQERRERDYLASAEASAKRQKQVALRASKREQFLDEAMSIIGDYSKMLAIKRSTLVVNNDLGGSDDRRWKRATSDFVETVLLPALMDRGLTTVRLEAQLRLFIADELRVGNWRKRAMVRLLDEMHTRIDQVIAASSPITEDRLDCEFCTPTEYEMHCERILCEAGMRVVRIGASGDHGVDLIAATDDGRRIGVQCKLLSRPAGNQAVQEVYAGARIHGCDSAIVVCNAGFTRAAREAAQRTLVALMHHSQLADFGKEHATESD